MKGLEGKGLFGGELIYECFEWGWIEGDGLLGGILGEINKAIFC